MLVSVLNLGFKLNLFSDVHQRVQRRDELEGNLELLERKLEGEKLAIWLGNVAHDEARREDTIAGLALEQVYDESEIESLDKGAAMFAMFESSQGVTMPLERATSLAVETKLAESSGLLLGKVHLYIRATPQQLVAYLLDFQSMHMQSTDWSSPNIVSVKKVAVVNAHHAIMFVRTASTGVSDRSFVNSIITKKVADEPATFIVAVVPVAGHNLVTSRDEAGAVRAEATRGFRFTEGAQNLTHVEYVCSLDIF